MQTDPGYPWRVVPMVALGVVVAALGAAATSCQEVTVTAVEPASVTVSPAEGTVAVGDTLRLRATVRDAAGNSLPDRPVQWVSEAPEVAELIGPAPEREGLVRALASGTAVIRASSGGVTGEASIAVLGPPGIALSRSEVALAGTAGAPPSETRAVEVANDGDGTLSGLAAVVGYGSDQPTGWLEAALQGTTAPTVLLLQADASDLQPGTYQGRVEVSASAASNSPQMVQVTFRVEDPPPAVAVDPGAVGFAMPEGGEVPSAQVVRVTNGGGGELTDLLATVSYPEGEPFTWLEAELAGTTAPTNLVLRVDPEGLQAPAVFDAVVEVTSPAAPGSSGVVRVRFRLGAPPPEMELSPREIGWEIVEGDPPPPAREVSIENRASGELGGLTTAVEYEAGDPGGWLEVALSSERAPSVLTASLVDTGLPPGEYESTIRVFSPDAINSPQTVTVRVQVSPRGTLLVVSIFQGNNQTGRVGEPLGTDLEVRVRSVAGPPVSGVTVLWETNDGSADPPLSVTGPAGRAATTWTLGPTPGAQFMEAIVPGVGSVTFQATADVAAEAAAFGAPGTDLPGLSTVQMKGPAPTGKPVRLSSSQRPRRSPPR